jgi:hypothetical protein
LAIIAPMRGRAVLLLTPLVVGVVLATAGCGGSGGSKSASTEAAPAVTPAPTTKAALDRLWHWIGVGSPAAITGYDAQLVDAVGRSKMLDALQSLRGAVKAGGLRVVDVSNTPLGQQVTVRQTIKGKPPQEYVYLLSRNGKDLVVAYDGRLTDALAGNAARTAIQRAQKKIDPKAKRPSPTAAATGGRASVLVRTQAVEALHPPHTATGAGSPRTALRRLWGLIRIGSPLAITAYNRKFVRAVGVSDLLVTLQSLRQPLNATRLKVVNVEGTGVGTLAVVRQTPKGGKPRESSYLLSRTKAGWVVDYDGIVAETVIAAATRAAAAKAQRKLDPKATKLAKQAGLAGVAAGDKVRTRLNSAVPDSVESQLAPQKNSG